MNHKNKIIYRDNNTTKFQVFSSKYEIKEVIVDTEDVERINKYIWYIYLDPKNYRFYLSTVYKKKNVKKYFTISLHRFIMRSPKNKVIDHIDGNGLNNRKENLRSCSHKENCRNRNKSKNGITSIYKGVSLGGRNKNRFRSTITIDGKQKHLGYFETEKEAALAYDNYLNTNKISFYSRNFNND